MTQIGGEVRRRNGGHRGGNPYGHEDGAGYGEVDHTDGEMGSRSSSFSASSPRSSVGSGSGSSRGSFLSSLPSNGDRFNGSRRASSPQSDTSSAVSGSFQSIPGVSARPGGVPFGASALSKTMSSNGRGRPRGLRPRGGPTSRTPGSVASGGLRSTSSYSSSAVPPSSLGRQSSSASSLRSLGGNGTARRGEPSATSRENEARAAEAVAPGVPVDDVVRAAIKIESVMRVLIARGYVRRKLVSEVTAFSLIMERGIEVIKHPFGGKAKSKHVTVNFVSRKGDMQLSWGGKTGVPLETIFGVTKGINTDALRAAVTPERADNCFSLHTSDRTIDFEVENPWLVLLVVRALRLFLGAHYDTLPAPTFFSHLCLRPRGTPRGSLNHGENSMVWTSSDNRQTLSPSAKEHGARSTPTERTSADSASDESGGGGRTSPWDRQGGVHGDGDSDSGSTLLDSVAGHNLQYPPPPNIVAPAAAAPAPPGMDVYGEREDGSTNERSPGGVMALFSTGGQSVSVEGLNSRSDSGVGDAASMRSGGSIKKEEPLTASQVLATRGFTKRLNLSKKLAANNNTGPLKGRRFDLMELPMDPGQQDRREKAGAEQADGAPKRRQGMSFSITSSYVLPEEKHRGRGPEGGGHGHHDSERMAVVDDLNDKLQSLRKLCVPQSGRSGSLRGGRATKTMAVKHMGFFQGGSTGGKGSGTGGGGTNGGGLGSVTDMWGDGVRRQYQTDMVRQKDQSVEDVHRRDSARTAMIVTRTAVHRVTRRAMPSDL